MRGWRDCHAHTRCAGSMRRGRAQGSCAEVVRRGHAQGSCAGVMRGGRAQGSCAEVVRRGRAQGSCAGVMRRGHAHRSCALRFGQGGIRRALEPSCSQARPGEVRACIARRSSRKLKIFGGDPSMNPRCRPGRPYADADKERHAARMAPHAGHDCLSSSVIDAANRWTNCWTSSPPDSCSTSSCRSSTCRNYSPSAAPCSPSSPLSWPHGRRCSCCWCSYYCCRSTATSSSDTDLGFAAWCWRAVPTARRSVPLPCLLRQELPMRMLRLLASRDPPSMSSDEGPRYGRTCAVRYRHRTQGGVGDGLRPSHSPALEGAAPRARAAPRTSENAATAP